MSFSPLAVSPESSPAARVPDAAETMAQLQRIVESPDFPASQRNRRFFRHVVERTLAGQRTSAREVAIEVFGRPPTFDSLKDPIVRIEADGASFEFRRSTAAATRAE